MTTLGLRDLGFLASRKGDIDPNFSSVSLLLHGDGANGSKTIIDSSLSPKTVTAFGDAQIRNSSIAFDGNGDFLQSESNIQFSFGTSDFTIEFWIYLNSTANQAFYETQLINGFGNRTNGFLFALNSGKLNVFANGSFKGASNTAIVSTAWHHIALVRSGNTWTYYLNGVNDGGFSYTANLTEQSFLCGRLTDAAAYFLNADVDEYRVTKGVARYTSNFTPPTAPFPDF